MVKFFDKLKTGFSKFGSWVKGAAKSVWGTGKSVVTSVYKDVKGIVKPIAETGTKLLGKAGETAIGAAEKITSLPTNMMYIGAAIAGGLLLWMLLNPRETKDIAVRGIEGAERIAPQIAKAAPLAIL